MANSRSSHPLQGSERRVSISPRTSADSVDRAQQRQEMDALLHEYCRTRSLRVRDEIVLRHTPLVRFIAGRFSPKEAVTPEDLVQVGYIGIISAIERFDPNYGMSFASFAIPTVVGVIKHYLRDHTWFLSAPRRLREFATRLRSVRGKLEQELGRSPTIAEIAASTGQTEEFIVQVMEVDLLYYPLSLDSRNAESADADRDLQDSVGTEEPAFGHIEARETLRQALGSLDDRERSIILDRFYGELSQGEVAERLGISQMHVSRLERRALQRLRSLLT